MSYYTQYDLYACDVPDSSRDAIIAEVEKIKALSRCSDGYVGNMCWSGYTTWYSYETDMLLLSKRFQDVLFELYGDGEESDDLWKAYFKNGAIQICKGTVVFDELDESSMQSPDHGFDWNNPYSYGGVSDIYIQEKTEDENPPEVSSDEEIIGLLGI